MATAFLACLSLAFLLLSTFNFSSASRPISNLKKQSQRHLSTDSSSSKLDSSQSFFPTKLPGNKPFPTESLLPAFPTFLKPIIFPSPFGKFNPTFPFPNIPTFPKIPPVSTNPNLPSMPSVPSDNPLVGPKNPVSPPTEGN